MNIILVSSRMAKIRSVSLNRLQLILLGVFGLSLFLTAVLAAQYALVRWQPQLLSAPLLNWLASAQQAEHQKQADFTRDSLDTLAKRLGQMQAQLLRLDSLGARLVKLSGIKPEAFSFDQVPAQGGPYLPATEPENPSLTSMDQELTRLSSLVADRSDKLVALETVVLQNSLSQRLLPTFSPVTEGWYSSNFGWRIDPFTGRQSLHEGVDFMAHEGTPIFASAGGVVIFAGAHPEYGNMVEIDHGHDIVTRYAHASKLLTQVGALVRRGDKIAEVGSTGRSTGNHLHFEVRYKGAAQNPVRFLQKAQS